MLLRPFHEHGLEILDTKQLDGPAGLIGKNDRC